MHNILPKKERWSEKEQTERKGRNIIIHEKKENYEFLRILARFPRVPHSSAIKFISRDFLIFSELKLYFTERENFNCMKAYSCHYLQPRPYNAFARNEQANNEKEIRYLRVFVELRLSKRAVSAYYERVSFASTPSHIRTSMLVFLKDYYRMTVDWRREEADKQRRSRGRHWSE